MVGSTHVIQEYGQLSPNYAQSSPVQRIDYSTQTAAGNISAYEQPNPGYGQNNAVLVQSGCWTAQAMASIAH